MARVTFDRLGKVYPGGVRAVAGVDLEVEDGEFVVLVGPSGCGKSTTLRMVAGLEEITEGTLSIGERVVNEVAGKDRDIAMVFQNYALYPHLTVRQNMAFPLERRRAHGGWLGRLVPGRGQEAREEDRGIAAEVTRAAEVLGITDLLDRKPGALSGGQRQRVAVGRALVRRPAAFLFDEPLSNLDAKLRHQTRGELKELHARVATTSIYVTHDQEEAMTLGDRVVVMKDGVIQQVGPPLEVYRRPANRFVATFIGAPAMNLVDAVVGEDGRSLRLPGGGGLPVDASLTPGASVVAGIRPQHLVEAPDGMECRVRVCEPLGDETDVMLDGPDGIQLTARLRLASVPTTGSTMRLGASAGDVHVFDAKSGIRLEAAVATA